MIGLWYKILQVHHFADDTNLHFNSSIKNLMDLIIWLNANKISHIQKSVQKTKLVIFKQKKKILENEKMIK